MSGALYMGSASPQLYRRAGVLPRPNDSLGRADELLSR